MIEEFTAIMGASFGRQAKAASPTKKQGPQHQLFLHFHLSSEARRLVFKLEGADLEAVLHVLRASRVTTTDNCWVPLMNLMILGCFLCEQPSGMCPYRLVSIVNQVRGGASP